MPLFLAEVALYSSHYQERGVVVSLFPVEAALHSSPCLKTRALEHSYQ